MSEHEQLGKHAEVPKERQNAEEFISEFREEIVLASRYFHAVAKYLTSSSPPLERAGFPGNFLGKKKGGAVAPSQLHVPLQTTNYVVEKKKERKKKHG